MWAYLAKKFYRSKGDDRHIICQHWLHIERWAYKPKVEHNNSKI